MTGWARPGRHHDKLGLGDGNSCCFQPLRPSPPPPCPCLPVYVVEAKLAQALLSHLKQLSQSQATVGTYACAGREGWDGGVMKRGAFPQPGLGR